jgi:hypothetical protein
MSFQKREEPFGVPDRELQRGVETQVRQNRPYGPTAIGKAIRNWLTQQTRQVAPHISIVVTNKGSRIEVVMSVHTMEGKKERMVLV